jgi:hypothetical protein
MSRRHRRRRSRCHLSRKQWQAQSRMSPEQSGAQRAAMARMRVAHQPAERLLQVQTEYFCAGAVFRKLYGVWSCTETAPVLHWMKGRDMAYIKLALLRMGADFIWVSPQGQGLGDSRYTSSATQQVEGTNPHPGVTNPTAPGGVAGNETATCVAT